MLDIAKKKMDIAYDMFVAISAVLPLQLHKDDVSFLILQLVQHYTLRFRYFALLEHEDFKYTNDLSAKSHQAKDNVISFLERHYGKTCSRVLNDVFGINNWKHVITDGSIEYEH